MKDPIDSLEFSSSSTFKEVAPQIPLEIRGALRILRTGHIDSCSALFFSFLSHCSRLEDLDCQALRDDFREVPQTIIPLLRRFVGPLSLAKSFTPGRPLEEIRCLRLEPRRQPPWGVGDLEPITLGTKHLKHLELGPFPWYDGSLFDIIRLFPHLEGFKIQLHGDVKVRGQPRSCDSWLFTDTLCPKNWPQEHLSEILEQLPFLNTVSVTSNSVKSFSEETLSAQGRALDAASISRPSFREAAFHEDVTWLKNVHMQWAAVHCLNGRSLVHAAAVGPQSQHSRIGEGVILRANLYFPVNPNYVDLPPHESVKPRLPNELFLDIVAALEPSNPDLSGSHAIRKSAPHRTAISNLSLANRSLRAIAQPTLFENAFIRGPISLSLFHAHRIEELLESRPESCRWFRVLHLSPVKGHGTRRDPTVEIQEEELWQVFSRLFVRMTELRRVDWAQITITSAMYRHLYRLPKLQALHCSGVTISHIPDFTGLSTQTLQIRELSFYAVETFGHTLVALLRLARGPSLHSLHLLNVKPRLHQNLLGDPPHSYNRLSSLRIVLYHAPLDHFLSLVACCPNINTIHLRAPLRSPIIVPTLYQVSPDTLQFLTHYCGPMNLARLLVPGRPVETLSLYHPSQQSEAWVKEELEPLTRGLPG